MKRVFVTGASGCIGRHVLPRLIERGWEVCAVSSRPIRDAGPVEWCRADLVASNAAAEAIAEFKPTHLLHLAWYIAPGRWAFATENFSWVDASVRLLRAFANAGGQRVVTAGSCLEYDWSAGICSEDRTPLKPHSTYGVCKHALQLLTSEFAARNELSSAWARPFFLYGPHEHQDRLVPAVIRAILAGQPARTSHGKQVRDYLYVQDVADAFVELLDSDVAGPINVASGQPVTLRQIVERIGDLMGRPDLLQLGAIPAASTDTPLVVADISRASKELPQWQPRVGLDEGLASSIRWWREQEAATPAATSR
jgi:nucleoside-diphosphate-sugar epimerase